VARRNYIKVHATGQLGHASKGRTTFAKSIWGATWGGGGGGANSVAPQERGEKRSIGLVHGVIGFV
jgi:hypothetical protein